MTQTWDPERYARNARYVADLAAAAIDLLSPKAGQRILDIGCGDGALTVQLAARGCEVIGIDTSVEQVAAARARGVDARVMDALHLDFSAEFDAVFSNMALHWIRSPDAVIAGVWRALRCPGRFVAELGGRGCIATIVSAIYAALARRGIDGSTLNPWHFPGADEYSDRLAAQGFGVDFIALIRRPTLLPGDFTGFIETFCEAFTAAVSAAERGPLTNEIREALRPMLFDPVVGWCADYTVLRFAATKA